MSDNALETLRLIFHDQPDLLKIIENAATLVKESQAKDIILPKNITELKELIQEFQLLKMN
ncbi:hypothetical protein RIVM261_091520 [Rivularia sp. IAM M-261]|nr:hypothetical protein CAL7716_020460 [Calothrix sp. PCC 7716]GJD24196.1 hypothetical protein RIVM261_091520 [Rivularia sp. IAM M-261]